MEELQRCNSRRKQMAKIKTLTNFKLVPTARLKSDPKNVRKHSRRNLDAIRSSYEQFGQMRPLVVDRDGVTVIAGNGQLEVARELKIEKLSVVQVDHLTPEQVRAFAVADNRTGELAEWDTDALLSSLASFTGDLKLAAGFLDSEIARLAPLLIKQDETPEIPKKSISKLGDVWQLGQHRLMCGDSTDEKSVRKLAGDSAAMLVTSPPYWHAQEYDKQVGIAGMREFMSRIAACWGRGVHRRIVINTGSTIETTLIGKNGRTGVQVLLDAEWVRAFESAGWSLRYRRVWVKRGFIMHSNPKTDLIDNSCESILVLFRVGNSEGGQERCGESWAQSGHWELDGVGKNLIGNDVVLEPFCGAGTTIIACEQLGRRCYAMELEPKYVDVAIARWEKFTGKKVKRV